jgi:hypothetical protein
MPKPFGSRTTLTRTRYGVADAVIDPAWLAVHPTGVRKVIISGGKEVGITASVRALRTAGLKIGDFLYESSLNLRLTVLQIIPEQTTEVALCQQVPQFIPDEFHNGSIEGFWTASQAGGTITETEPVGGILIIYPTIQTGLAGAGPLLYQTVSGDFDIFCRVAVTNAGLGAGQFVYGLIGARIDSTHGVYVGLRRSTDAAEMVRIDQYGGGAGQQSEVVSVTGVNFVRMRRQGTAFRAYYSTAAVDNPPETESGWAEIKQTSNEQVSGASVQLGLSSWANAAALDEADFDYVRNIKPA